MVDQQIDGAEGGKQNKIPSTFKYGKKCYSERYYDGKSHYK